MSLPAQQPSTIPEQTARVARAIYPNGNPVMRLLDALHLVVTDSDFADPFPLRGQPGESPARLALVSLLQFMEGLTDRQAAEAVRTRIDWKYLLGLELCDPGFDHTVLSEIRSRLLAHGAERRLFDAVLTLAQNQGLLQAGGRQRSDSTHVLGKIRMLGHYPPFGSRFAVRLDPLQRATGRGRHRALGRQQGRQLRQRAGRDNQRALQVRDHSPPRTLENFGSRATGNPRMGVVVQPSPATGAHRLHSTRRS